MYSADSSTIPKIVVIGSCSIDFTTYASRLPNPGETIHGYKFTTSFGGKGANQCVAAARLGGNTHMICRVGNDQWGTLYKNHLQEEGVNITHVRTIKDVTTGIAQINVAENGENQIVIVPGANGDLSIEDVKMASELIKSADILIGQLETPFKTTLEAFKLNSGLKLLNAAPGMADIEEILQYCSILCINESEAVVITNLVVDTVQSAAKALSKLLEMGCESAIITLGEKGALYGSRQDHQLIHVLCEHVTPVDTTGAGDAFVGALAVFLVTKRNCPIHQVIGAACHIATISVTKEGTQTSYPINNNAFNKEYQYKRL